MPFNREAIHRAVIRTIQSASSQVTHIKIGIGYILARLKTIFLRPIWLVPVIFLLLNVIHQRYFFYKNEYSDIYQTHHSYQEPDSYYPFQPFEDDKQFDDYQAVYEPCDNINGSITDELLSSFTKRHEKFEILEWMYDICPEVINHVLTFPMFDRIPFVSGQGFVPPPIFSNSNSIKSLCTMKIVKLLADKLEARVFLHAGSALGALLHGGPIPWDDDVDMFLDFDYRDQFLDLCAKFHVPPLTAGNETSPLVCVIGDNAIKVFVMDSLAHKTGPGHYSPFVDLFMFKEKKNEGIDFIQEVDPEGRDKLLKWPCDTYFPTRDYYFGGLILPGPNEKVSRERYDASRCYISNYNHWLERAYPLNDYELNCCKLAQYFPFAYYYKSAETTYQILIVKGKIQMVNAFNNSVSSYVINDSDPILNALLLPKINIDFDNTEDQVTDTDDPNRFDFARKMWYIPGILRKTYLDMVGSISGSVLTKQLPNLDKVEVNNWALASDRCKSIRWDNFRVVEINAQRGKNWKEIAQLLEENTDLQNADVVILNEMDIGMARSNNSHTTRLLAHVLEMNYAWAVEFVELTNGDQSEQESTLNKANYLGLHGNAILSKCPLKNCVVYRDDLDSAYFSRMPTFTNAHGWEIRLGGRGALICELWTPFEEKMLPPILGSIHKLSSPTHFMRIKEAIKDRKAIIAGDQNKMFCEKISLEKDFDENVPTWPATCNSLGSGRGDIMCSNVKRLGNEVVLFPCLNGLGLGDHAIITNDYELFNMSKI